MSAIKQEWFVSMSTKPHGISIDICNIPSELRALMDAAAARRDQPWTDADIKRLVNDTAHAND